jgi:hypothetical protein
MVLETASIAESDSFSQDGIPSSDLDPYDGNQKPTAFTLDSNLPRPIPILGPLLGYTPKNQAQSIGRGLGAASQLLHRALRKEEAEAFAYNVAKMERTNSYGSALGLSAGLYRSWSTASTYRFPLFQPNLETFNPNSIATLRGAVARAAIHSLRSLAYGANGLFLALLFFKSYSGIVFAVATKTDPRLKDLVEAMGRLAEERSGAVRKKPDTSHGAEGYATNTPDDDMSPQSAPYTENAPYNTESSYSSDTNPDSTPESKEPPLSENARLRKAYQDAKRAAPSRESRDDLLSTSEPSESPYPRESAWDRVRREAASSGQGQSSQRSRSSADRSGATLGDSFTFSATDEERQLAKQEAQKDFDARVERERQGNDFEENSSGKRW